MGSRDLLMFLYLNSEPLEKPMFFQCFFLLESDKNKLKKQFWSEASEKHQKPLEIQ